MALHAHELAGAIESDGYAVVPDVVGPEVLVELSDAIDRIPRGPTTIERGGRVYAMRDLLERVPEVRQLAGSARIRALVEPVLGPSAFAVRGLLFDKTPEANWVVPWHQDMTIAVLRKTDAAGFGPWTVKGGVPHVRPPVEVLEHMLAVRVHLDDCGESNGPLRILPGSHLMGRLGDRAAGLWLARGPAVSCVVRRGGVLLMRPLLLHASSPADRPGRRRVIHLEFAADLLPGGVEWFETVGSER